MNRNRLLALAASVPALACARPAQVPLTGQYMPDCAPWDGAAFAVKIPSRAAGGTFWLKGWAGLDEAAGTWRHVFQGERGDGQIALCSKSGQRDCSYPESGTFTITGRAWGQLRGTLDARFPDGKRYRFAFTAMPQPPPRQPVLCG